MWPWGHLALAYLVYAAYSHLRLRHRPTEAAALLVVLGSQAPDLVDKPFAWTLSVLPTGRSLTHSLLVVVPLLVGASLLARRRGENEEPLVVAFAFGAVVHSLGDALYPVLDLELRHAGFLAWPVVATPEYEVEQSFAAHLALIDPSPELLFELLLVCLAAVVWYRDGTPGLATVRAWSGRLLRGVTGTRS